MATPRWRFLLYAGEANRFAVTRVSDPEEV